MRHYTPEDGAPLTPNTREILDSLYAKPRPGSEAYSKDSGFPCKEFVLFFIFMWLAYWPLARGFCWLVLAVGYWCGADGAVWPGPYTPYPERLGF